MSEKKPHLYSYQPFDKVWYLNESKHEGVCPKLQPLFTGPCLVTKRFNDLNFEIQLDYKTFEIVNHNKLKPYHGSTKPKWMTDALKRT